MQAEIKLELFFFLDPQPERDERFTFGERKEVERARSGLAWFVLILPGNCII